jgi:hypothetical protein
MRTRISGRAEPVGAAALAGFVATAALTYGAVATTPRSPINNLVLVHASENTCTNALCPKQSAPPDPDSGDQTTAEQRIIDGYIPKQKGPSENLATGSQNMQVAPIFWRGTRSGQAGEPAHTDLLELEALQRATAYLTPCY